MDSLTQALCAGKVAYIPLYRSRSAAKFLRALDGLYRRIRMRDIIDDNVSPFFGESQYDRLTDPLTAARH